MNISHNNRINIIPYFIGTITGAFIFLTIVLIHDVSAGHDLYIFTNYLVPIVFGSGFGYIITDYIYQKSRSDSALIETVTELEKFFGISLAENRQSVEKWARTFSGPVTTKCYEFKNCKKTDCVAYFGECGRCWLKVGTMCDEKVQNNFLEKRECCTKCNFYKGFVGKDITRHIRELTFSLIQNVFWQNTKLIEAEEEVNKLRGIIPICSKCKKIRDDKGYWNRLEKYISENSEVEFSHSYCNDCIRELYPEIAEEVIKEIEIKNK